jgi:hypothetical protein
VVKEKLMTNQQKQKQIKYPKLSKVLYFVKVAATTISATAPQPSAQDINKLATYADANITLSQDEKSQRFYLKLEPLPGVKGFDTERVAQRAEAFGWTLAFEVPPEILADTAAHQNQNENLAFNGQLVVGPAPARKALDPRSRRNSADCCYVLDFVLSTAIEVGAAVEAVTTTDTDAQLAEFATSIEAASYMLDTLKPDRPPLASFLSKRSGWTRQECQVIIAQATTLGWIQPIPKSSRSSSINSRRRRQGLRNEMV